MWLLLSIHDLTRRSTKTFRTILPMSDTFNSRPHKEVDCRRVNTSGCSFIFQFTTSQGGRHGRKVGDSIGQTLSIHDLTRRSTAFLSPFYKNMHLSIHDLTRRSTKTTWLPFVTSTFQFTTSQGGRLENDDITSCVYLLSIHDLTRRSTRYRFCQIYLHIFQFTTSQGGRRLLLSHRCHSMSFQFTTSQGGRLQHGF